MSGKAGIKQGDYHTFDFIIGVENKDEEYSGYSIHIKAEIRDKKWICKKNEDNPITEEEFDIINEAVERMLRDLYEHHVKK